MSLQARFHLEGFPPISVPGADTGFDPVIHANCIMHINNLHRCLAAASCSLITISENPPKDHRTQLTGLMMDESGILRVILESEMGFGHEMSTTYAQIEHVAGPDFTSVRWAFADRSPRPTLAWRLWSCRIDEMILHFG